MKILVTIFLLFQITTLFAQKNTEQFRTVKDFGIYNNFRAGFELSSGNEEFIKLSGGYRLDYFHKNFYTFLVGDIEYKEGNSKIISNRGFLHYRFIYKDIEIINPEIFTQIEYDEFLLIEHRELIGAGLRLDISNYSAKDSTPKIDFDIGLGLMQEYEKYKLINSDKSNLLRSSNFLSLFVGFNEKSQFNVVIYFQPAVHNLNDYRILGEMKLQFPIFSNFSFYTQVNYRYDNEPLPTLKNYSLGLNNGFTLTF